MSTVASADYAATVPWAGVLGKPVAFTPETHAAMHKAGGSDALRLDDLAAPTDSTKLNSSTSAHGLLPKLSGSTAQFLNGAGQWAVPPGAGGATTQTFTGGDVVTGASPAILRLVPTAVTPGAYTAANITVDANGRITAAASGGGSGSGDVVGPASAVVGQFASFSNVDGKHIQDSGKAAPSGVIVGTTDTQTLDNKTLNAPKFSGDATTALTLRIDAAGTLGPLLTLANDGGSAGAGGAFRFTAPSQTQPIVAQILSVDGGSWTSDIVFQTKGTSSGAALVERGRFTTAGLTVTGNIGATNFSGTSSGTNTGDQTNISGNAATATALTGWNTPALTGAGLTWPSLTGVKSDGVLEIGKYLDFHSSSADAGDYENRITSSAGLLTASGNFAATQIDSATLGSTSTDTVIRAGGTSPIVTFTANLGAPLVGTAGTKTTRPMVQLNASGIFNYIGIDATHNFAIGTDGAGNGIMTSFGMANDLYFQANAINFDSVSLPFAIQLTSSGRVRVGGGADNGVNALQVNGTLVATNFRSTDVFNVKDYGATGNGVNDAAHINAAIAALNASSYGGELVFPPGDYYVTSALTTITKTVHVRGAGAEVTTLRCAAGVDGLVIDFSATARSSATVSGLNFKTDNGYTTGNTALRFRQYNSGFLNNSFEFHSLNFAKAWSKAIHVDNTTLNNTQGGSIHDINIQVDGTGNGKLDYGIYVAGASNVNVYAVRAFECTTGFYVSSSPACEGVWITDCLSVNCKYGVEAHGANTFMTNVHVNVSAALAGGAGVGFLVDGNQSMLKGCYVITDDTATIAYSLNATQVSAIGNLCLRSSSTMSKGIVLGANAAHNVIQGNYLMNTSGPAIELNASSHDNIVTGNSYASCSATYPINDLGSTNTTCRDNFDHENGVTLLSASKCPVGYVASATWDPANLVPGAQDFTNISVAGAAFGQGWVVGVPYDLQNMMSNAIVTSSGTVRINVFNSNSGTTVNLGSGTWTVTRVS